MRAAMSPADRASAAATRAEKAMQDLAIAYTDLANAVSAIPRPAYADQSQRPLEIRLPELLVMRLRALGLGPVLAQARTPGRLADGWERDFTGAIHAAMVRR